MANVETPRRDFRSIVGMDPAADWLLGPALDDFLAEAPDPENALVPLLIEFGSEEAVAAFLRLPPLGEGDDGNGFLVLGRSSESLAPGTLAAVLTTPERLLALLDDGPAEELFRAAPKRILLANPSVVPEDFRKAFPDYPPGWDLEHAFSPRSKVKAPAKDWPPGTVIIGVIDDGIAVGHARLRRSAVETRVEAYLDMNQNREFTRADIDAALVGSQIAGVVDEDEFYRRIGAIDHSDPRHHALAWRRAHGAHVTDLAAGADFPDPAAAGDATEAVEDRPVIAVQLPSPIVAHTTGEKLEQAVFLGILYILDRARRLSPQKKPLPLVINVSLGYIAGAHDGSGVLETYMDSVVTKNPHVRIVLSAGNAQLSRCHATIDLGACPQVELDWIVQPSDRTHSLLQVRIPGPWSVGLNRLRMAVKAPDGRELKIDETTAALQDLKDATGQVQARLYRVIETAPGGERVVFHLRIRPSDRPHPQTKPMAPAGRWKLTFTPGSTAMSRPAEAWVQRDDSLYGYPQRGRQPYFEDPNYLVYDANGRRLVDDSDPPQPATPSVVTRQALFNAVGTGGRVITAGGYQQRDGRVADYSAGGPNFPATGKTPATTKPDALLPSEGSRAQRGILAAGSRSGSRVPMSGTSVAAPQLTRYVADRLAAGTPADRAQIAQEALTSPIGAAPPASMPAGRAAGLLAGDRRGPERFELGDWEVTPPG